MPFDRVVATTATASPSASHSGGFRVHHAGTTGRRRLFVALLVTALVALTAILSMPTPASATQTDGKAYSWGANTSGELGDGTNTDSSVPVAVLDSEAMQGRSVRQIASGGSTACVVTTDGLVFCWGDGQSGQFGNDTSGPSNFSNQPVQVDMEGALSGRTLVQVSVGGSSVCALASSGEVFCWGDNSSGQLGTGDTTSSLVPVAANAGPLAGKTLARIDVAFAYACAIDTSSAAYCWGNGIFGQLGNGASANSPTPVEVEMAGLEFVDIQAYTFTTCAITTDAEAYCWGRNNQGQIGDGTTQSRNVPTPVSTSGLLAGQRVISIAPGDEATCAVTEEGAIACWGDNSFGQLGNGSNTPTDVPESVDMTGVLADKRPRQVSVAYELACVVNFDGSIGCWGNGSSGAFGNGSNDSSTVPVLASTGGMPFSQVSTNNYFTYGVVTHEAPTTCALTVTGARPAKKKLPLNRKVTLVQSTSVSPECSVQVRAISKRGDQPVGVKIRINDMTGKITAKAKSKGARAILRIQARASVDSGFVDSAVWKRTWRS